MGGGGGVTMSIFGGAGMLVPLLLWAVLLAFLAWAMVGILRREALGVVERSTMAEDVLRERVARIQTSAREFEEAT
jgi:uncharacterized membrane protein